MQNKQIDSIASEDILQSYRRVMAYVTMTESFEASHGISPSSRVPLMSTLPFLGKPQVDNLGYRLDIGVTRVWPDGTDDRAFSIEDVLGDKRAAAETLATLEHIA